jgi:hypothetical protein
MLDWLKGPGVRRTLQFVAARGVITHEALDALPPGRILVHVRSMLVAAGAPPARDERLATLEAGSTKSSPGRPIPGTGRPCADTPFGTTCAACTFVARLPPPGHERAGQVAAAAAFLDRLTAADPGRLYPAELDQWLAGTSGHLVRSTNFVRWEAVRRHAACLTTPASR